MAYPEVGTKEAYAHYLAEATIHKWIRNIIALGGIASTAIYNTEHDQVSTTTRAAVTGGILATTSIVSSFFEKERRGSIHDSHVEAAFATIHAEASNEPAPTWANGNTGKIFDRSEVTSST